jgi:hypothetical protein
MKTHQKLAPFIFLAIIVGNKVTQTVNSNAKPSMNPHGQINYI